MKDCDPARVDNPFLIEELSEERPGILLWMLEGLHRLLANRYQFTISERSIQNLEAAMADSDNLTQFMQATAYVRFKPDTEERSTYLYRAYTKWCEDNLESPVPQKKFSQFLLKKCREVWPDLFQAHLWAAASGQERQALTYLPAHKGAAQPELHRVWRSAKETCL